MTWLSTHIVVVESSELVRWGTRAGIIIIIIIIMQRLTFNALRTTHRRCILCDVSAARWLSDYLVFIALLIISVLYVSKLICIVYLCDVKLFHNVALYFSCFLGLGLVVEEAGWVQQTVLQFLSISKSWSSPSMSCPAISALSYLLYN